MLPKWLQDRLAPGYRKQIHTQSQYQAAAGYLRSQMQELVNNCCPDTQDVASYQRRLDALTEILRQLQYSLTTMDEHLQHLTQQVPSAQDSQSIPAEILSLSQSVKEMEHRLRSLDRTLNGPLPDTYEDTVLLLEDWQNKQQDTLLQLCALKQLTFRDLSTERTGELYTYQELFVLLQKHMSKTDTLTHQLLTLENTLTKEMKQLEKCLALHRRFLQKEGTVQQQFDVLNRQVPALLSQTAVSTDWYDLVQSWYKANNLANSNIKSLTALWADYKQLLARHTDLSGQTEQMKARHNQLLPLIQTDTLQSSLAEFQNTVTGLQQQVLQQEQQLLHFGEKKKNLREQAKRKAMEEGAQLQKLWAALEASTTRYVSRKESDDFRKLFEQIQAILQAPYCLRTLHHSPIPDALTNSVNHVQYLGFCNKSFLSRELNRLDSYFSHFQGKSLTPAQRSAVLTEEDYVQVIGQKGFGKSFTITAKKQYLMEQLKYSPNQIMVWHPKKNIPQQILELLQRTNLQAPQGLTHVWEWQEQMKQQFPPTAAWDILLPALELYQYLCPAGHRLPLSKEPLNTFSGQERESAETLYQDFRMLVQLYRELLEERQLVDRYQALHLGTQLFQSGQVAPAYTHCLVDDFPLLSPLELALLRALLKSDSHIKLFCTGEHWEPLNEMNYIKAHFPRLPWTHFLVQELLEEGKQFIAVRNYQGGYLSLTETRGEVILLSPLDESTSL